MTKPERSELFPIDKKTFDQSIASAYGDSLYSPESALEMLEAVLFRTSLDILLDDSGWEDSGRAQFAVDDLTAVCACWIEIQALTQSCAPGDPVSLGLSQEVPLDPKILWESEEFRGRDPVEEMLRKKASEEMLKRCGFLRKAGTTERPTGGGEEHCGSASSAECIET